MAENVEKFNVDSTHIKSEYCRRIVFLVDGNGPFVFPEGIPLCRLRGLRLVIRRRQQI
jgi:hypothetical protein